MTTPLLLICPVGLEDLVRGDLRDQHGVVSHLTGVGQITVDDLSSVELVGPLVERVQVPLDGDGSVSRAAELIGVASPAFRVQAQDARTRADWIARIESRGWVNDPSNWLLNIDADAGAIDLGPWHWLRRIGQLRRLPATTPRPGCSRSAAYGETARRRPAARPLRRCWHGADRRRTAAWVPAHSIERDPEATRLAAENTANLSVQQSVSVIEADATDLPFENGSIDRVVSDLPFGKRIGSNELNKTLYPAILREIERVLTADGRCVLLSDDKRVFAESVAHARGLKISGERVIRYNGVTPTAYIVRRSRRPKQRRS